MSHFHFQLFPQNRGRTLVLSWTLLLGISLSLAAFSFACNSGGSNPGREPLLKIDGKTLSFGDLSTKYKMALHQADTQYFQMRQQALDRVVGEMLMEGEAKKQGISVEELQKREITDKAPKPTQAEVDEFYNQNKARITEHLKSRPKGEKMPSTKEIKEAITAQIADRRMRERYANFMSSLRGSHKVEILVKEPEAPRMDVPEGDGNPSKGSKGARVKIVEFSDFQCPFCSRAAPIVSQIEKEYGDKVRITFRDFPLSFHKTAKRQAEASHCANDQSKFWDYHDKLFASQDRVQSSFGGGNMKMLDETLVTFAKEIGLQDSKFSECLNSGKFTEQVQKNIQAGDEAGVNSTPTFFINGKMIAGAVPFEEFKKVIDEEMAKN